MKTFEQFWSELSPAYPISKGAMRLPIVTTLQTLPGLDMALVLADLQTLLEGMLEKHATAAGATARAESAGESAIVPLIISDYTGVVRFDCVLDDTGAVKVLELNADYPDGLLLHDATYSALTDSVCTLHTDNYLKLFSNQAAVHISHPAEAVFLDAFYTEKLALEAAGHQVSIGAVSPSAPLQYHRRGIEVSKMSVQDLQQWQGIDVQHINSFALRTLGYKDLLADSTHPYIPQTILLDATNRAEVAVAPAKWVLKPANGCEGQGIYFGKNYEESKWKQLLDTLPIGYIAQEFVSLPKQSISIYIDGDIKERELFYDFCPHFFIQSGRVVGTGHILMRFSESPVVNVSQGGAIGYHQAPLG